MQIGPATTYVVDYHAPELITVHIHDETFIEIYEHIPHNGA